MDQLGPWTSKVLSHCGKIATMSAVTITSVEGTRASTSTTDRYFVNAPIDALVIGGASVALYAIFRLRPELASSPSVASLAAALVWVCNYPHFAATNYRLYHSRASMAQYPLTSFVTPIVMVAAVIGCYLSPQRDRPAVHQALPALVAVPLLRADARDHDGLRPTDRLRDRRLATPLPDRVHLLDLHGAERLGRGRPSRQSLLRCQLPHPGRARLAAGDLDEADVGGAGRHDRHADVEDRQRRPTSSADRADSGVHAVRMVRGHPRRAVQLHGAVLPLAAIPAHRLERAAQGGPRRTQARAVGAATCGRNRRGG